MAVLVDGCEVTTMQGLADGELHPVQTAFHEEHALQRGYCTAEMIMASVDLLMETPDPGDDEIRHGLEGNLNRPGFVGGSRVIGIQPLGGRLVGQRRTLLRTRPGDVSAAAV